MDIGVRGYHLTIGSDWGGRISPHSHRSVSKYSQAGVRARVNVALPFFVSVTV